MQHSRPRRLSSCLAGFLAVFLARQGSTYASNGFDTPEGGTEQVSRGGAWVARADTPLAAYYNPAGLTTQSSGVHISAQLMLREHCFDRVDTNGNRVAPGGFPFLPPPDEVCADIAPFPNPQLGLALRLHKQWAIGLAVVGPHTHGFTEWPSTLKYPNSIGVEAEAPAPQRYLLIKAEPLAIFPTLSVAFAPLKQLHFGAGFSWGIAAVDVSNIAEAVSNPRDQPDDFFASQDVLANVKGVDAFVPGFVLGALWQAHRRVDLAGWYRFSDGIRATVDLRGEAPYYLQNGSVNPSPTVTEVEEAGTFELAFPMEARIGVRYRHPRRGGEAQQWITDWKGWARDSMSEDLFDIELDVAWAHNSAVENVDVTFNERYQIEGTPGLIPLDASVPHNWRDSVSFRLGGEFVAIPDFLALRTGGFFETQAGREEFLNIDFDVSARAGISGGVGLRLSRFDINVSYMHTFFLGIDNEGNGAVRGVSGTTDDFRTRQVVNGGKTRSSLNEVGLGFGVHW